MAIASDSIPTPARPLLPFADPRTAVDIIDDLRREVERQEAGCGDITMPSAICLTPAPAEPAHGLLAAASHLLIDEETDEPQTARSIGLGTAGWDFADVVDLASLAAGQRRYASYDPTIDSG